MGRADHHRLQGRIAGVGFGSGDRVVVGHWDHSPIGPFVDLMWATPEDERILVVPDERVGHFVRAVYEFDSVEVAVGMGAAWDGRTLAVWAGARRVALRVGPGLPFPPRPRWVTRWIEPPLARLLTGSRTFGVSPSGVREWYPAQRVHLVRAAEAAIDDRDLGPFAAPLPAVRFGFSEPPRVAALTEVAPVLWDPSGRLDRTLADLEVAVEGSQARS